MFDTRDRNQMSGLKWEGNEEITSDCRVLFTKKRPLP